MEQATIEEDKVYADRKTEIREEIRDLRHRVFMLPFAIDFNYTHVHTHTILTTIFQINQG